jgi:hypothetical protein
MFLARSQKQAAKSMINPLNITIKELISLKTARIRSISGDTESIKMNTFAVLKTKHIKFRLK